MEPYYSFNNTNGDWYKITDKKPIQEGYEAVTGKYIVERYLLDDIWETDKVELALNESNFLIGKLLPTSFQRACTMGTAGIWKLIMLAWCYENKLAIPAFAPSKTFTGGLSRLIVVGYIDHVVKLDFNSLYPSIDLTWNVNTTLDISDSMLMMLNYILTQREKYKELKAIAGAKSKKLKKELKKLLQEENPNQDKIKELELEIQKWDAEKSANDKKQLPLKILANSFFGSYGSPNIFPFGDTSCAEKTTTIGRQCLRLMISHFTGLGYRPIVGDSVTGDTPLFVKYNKTNMIDIKPIEEIINSSEIKVDELGREYDYSEKDYKVLCRSGWEDVKYVYRHKTDKPIYTIQEGDMVVEVTEDHSLFNENQEKIKPSEINNETKLEYYKKPLRDKIVDINNLAHVQTLGKMLGSGVINRVPITILNADNTVMKTFLDGFECVKMKGPQSKTAQAGLLYIKSNLNK